MGDIISLSDPFTVPTRYWHQLEDGRLQCDACPRACKLREGQRGVCFVRGRIDDQVVLTSYGRSSGYCIDPIEKKPLNHFLPGTSVLSFGTAGCNLACRFCQNWDISKSKQVDRMADAAPPESIADAARQLGCASVAFTYNDPVVFVEYAVDTATACREQGVRSVAVSAGYATEPVRRELYSAVDAANIDLKGFTDEFYRHVAMGELAPVLDTLRFIRHETDTWLEITTLLIPGLNDSDDRAARDDGVDRRRARARRAAALQRLPPRLQDARRAGHAAGDAHAGPGASASTKACATSTPATCTTARATPPLCPSCGAAVIERDWYELKGWQLTGDGHCQHCGAAGGRRLRRPARRVGCPPGAGGAARADGRGDDERTNATPTPDLRPSPGSSTRPTPTDLEAMIRADLADTVARARRRTTTDPLPTR